MNKKYLILGVTCLIATIVGIWLFIFKDFEIDVLLPTVIFAAISLFSLRNIKGSE